jgi:hypothetical protein
MWIGLDDRLIVGLSGHARLPHELHIGDNPPPGRYGQGRHLGSKGEVHMRHGTTDDTGRGFHEALALRFIPGYYQEQERLDPIAVAQLGALKIRPVGRDRSAQVSSRRVPRATSGTTPDSRFLNQANAHGRLRAITPPVERTMMSTPRQILIDALRSVWPQVDAASLTTMADQLLLGQSATLGTSTASLTFGQDNDFRDATITIGTIAGRDVLNLSIHFPQPITPAPRDRDRERVIKAARHVESERLLALRLTGFVGRNAERDAICASIESIRPMGGYIVVKAHAGEGKSSIIAKLIDEAGVTNTPHHFIAMTPGREYHLSLLRTLVAQLILKYDLDTGYFPDESYPAMKDLFAAVLRDVAAQGHEETIYLDGLDQLEPELSGVRDLSFLPPQPPPGMVIVLGTRPDDTLRPLEPLHKVDYWLPKLSQTDFTTFLQARAVYLPSTQVMELYAALEGNALYLTLAATQLQRTAQADIAGLVRTITANPGSLFTVTLDRIRRSHERLWERVIYPVLGILLVSQEPLRAPLLRTLLQVTADDLRHGLDRLGGLVSQSSDGAFFLYHLKFREYLAEPVPNAEGRDSLFDQDEVIEWHQRLAAWCLPDDAAVKGIWQPGGSAIEEGRRQYARHHAITHLALGHFYDRMWSILEDGRYGRYKRRFDPSTHLYTLDLDRARHATPYHVGHMVAAGLAAFLVGTDGYPGTRRRGTIW